MKNFMFKTLRAVGIVALLSVSSVFAGQSLNLHLCVYGDLSQSGHSGKADVATVRKTLLKARTSDKAALVVAAGTMNSVTGIDPAPGVVKGTLIIYRAADGAVKLHVANEYQDISLPGTNSYDLGFRSDVVGSEATPTVVKAFYGDFKNLNKKDMASLQVIDVTGKISSSSNTLTYPAVTNEAMGGDPVYGIVKSLIIIYRCSGKLGIKILQEGSAAGSIVSADDATYSWTPVQNNS